MLIASAFKFKTADPYAYAWARLRAFENASYVADRLIAVHKVPPKHHENARKQARQIRYCLLQAREYFEAGRRATLSTRPALLYYGAMSLALAEILYKNSGEKRLEKLREQHGAHGLALTVSGNMSVGESFTALSSSLVAKAQISTKGEPFGTFEVWRASSRESPLCGTYVEHFGAGKTSSSFRALMFGADVQPPPLPGRGVSLLDCLKRLPQMRDVLATCGETVEVVRGTATGTLAQDRREFLKIVIHPAKPEILERCISQFIFSREATIDQIKVVEFPVGVSVEWEVTGVQTQVSELPYGIAESTESVYFSCRREILNELGLLYVALHIVGNLARYYPDKWLAHVESSSQLAMAVEQLLQLSIERLPMLCLSELTQTLFVAEA